MIALTMRMNGDQERRAGTLVAVSLGVVAARLSWRVMRGVRHQGNMVKINIDKISSHHEILPIRTHKICARILLH